MINRVLTFLLGLLFLAALLLLVIPWIFFFTTAPFGGKLAYTLCFVAIAAEKIWAMFFRMRQRFAPDVEKDWTTVTVGYAFAAVMYLALIEYFVKRQSVPLAATVGGKASSQQKQRRNGEETGAHREHSLALRKKQRYLSTRVDTAANCGKA